MTVSLTPPFPIIAKSTAKAPAKKATAAKKK
jgi:hypothetical protein